MCRTITFFQPRKTTAALLKTPKLNSIAVRACELFSRCVSPKSNYEPYDEYVSKETRRGQQHHNVRVLRRVLWKPGDILKKLKKSKHSIGSACAADVVAIDAESVTGLLSAYCGLMRDMYRRDMCKSYDAKFGRNISKENEWSDKVVENVDKSCVCVDVL